MHGPVQKAFSPTPTYQACDCHQQRKQEDLLSLGCKVNTAQSSTVRISPRLDAADTQEARETEALHCVKTVDRGIALCEDSRRFSSYENG